MLSVFGFKIPLINRMPIVTNDATATVARISNPFHTFDALASDTTCSLRFALNRQPDEPQSVPSECRGGRGAPDRQQSAKLPGYEPLILVARMGAGRLMDLFCVALGDRLIASLRAGLLTHLRGLICIFFGLSLWLCALLIIGSEYHHAIVW